jgi:hypothetical protein
LGFHPAAAGGGAGRDLAALSARTGAGGSVSIFPNYSVRRGRF